MLLFKKFWVFPALFLVFWGCRKPTSANWDVDVVVPVVNSTLNIKHFIGDSIFKADSSGLLSLSINREIASLKLDSLLNLPDTTISPPPFFPPINYPLQTGSYIMFPATEVTFNIGNGVQLKRADVRTGILTVHFSNTVSQPLNLTYSIPNATKNGQAFLINEVIPPGNNTLVKNYDLSGYSLNLTGQNGFAFNTITQTYTLGLAPGASSVVVPNTQGVIITINYTKITPQFVEGYFGTQVIDIATDTVKIGLLNNIKASNFMLSDATMNFNVINEFGAEFSGYFSNIKSINNINSSSISLSSNQLSNINLNSATRSGATINPSTWPINLNKNNSNVVPFISNLPDQLTYRGRVTLNPNGNISGYNNFAFYNTGIHIVAAINIPLRFTANYFRLQSVANVDFSNTAQLQHVNSGKFMISASNGYPFDATLQAYLMDENKHIIDSLFIPNANTLAKGQLNGLNEVTFPTRSRLEVPVSKDKINNLRRSKFIQVVTYFMMPPNPPEIKLYEDYQFDVNIIAQVNYNVGAE